VGSILYDFLGDSVLFNEAAIAQQYRGLTDGELTRELGRYREFCLEKHSELIAEASPVAGHMSLVASLGSTPIDLLRRGALYLDRFVIDDPLFPLSAERDDLQLAYTALVTGKPKNLSVDRSDILRAVSYLKTITPFVAKDYVRVLPFSLRYEPPKALPILYSETLFREALPDELRDFFKKRARIREVKRAEGRLLVMRDPPKAPCRGIGIEFEGDDEHAMYGYNLLQSAAEQVADSHGRFRFKMRLPDTPPDREQYETWVEQSLNQAASQSFRKITSSMAAAAKFDAMYLAPNRLAAEIADFALEGPQPVRPFVASQVLALDLPWLEAISADTLMEVRENDGEAFATFRVALEAKIRELRAVKDPDKLRVGTENAIHDLTETQVRLLDTKMKGLRDKMAADAVLVGLGLAGAVQLGGLTVLGAVGAAVHGFSVWQQYRSAMREHPGYFTLALKHASK
jgi:hypothetical protein